MDLRYRSERDDLPSGCGVQLLQDVVGSGDFDTWFVAGVIDFYVLEIVE